MRLLGCALGLFLMSGLGYSAIRVDMTPTRVMLRDVIVDDVSNFQMQAVYVYVKNVGNVDMRIDKRISVRVNRQLLEGFLYGPDNRGGSLYGPVRPGEEGKISLRVPLRTFSHCQRLDVHVDTARKVQATTDGGDVFANDRKTLVAFEYGNRRLCPVLPRPLPLPLPLP